MCTRVACDHTALAIPVNGGDDGDPDGDVVLMLVMMGDDRTVASSHKDLNLLLTIANVPTELSSRKEMVCSRSSSISTSMPRASIASCCSNFSFIVSA